MREVDFIHTVLVPAANESLKSFYDRYCSGDDIGIETKSDESPASLADRETEKVLRDLIMREYPDHGIWGEEFGAYNTERDYVWVLDPLDGTRQFIDKRPGFFGSLIGFLAKGKAVAGAISDPIYGDVFLSDDKFKITDQSSNASKVIIACTHPIAMLDADFTDRLSSGRVIKKDMNCMAFVALLNGEADVFVEHDLALHDVVALIAVMTRAGMVVVNFEGYDYCDYVFDVSQASTQKYGIIAARNQDIAQEILNLNPKGLSA